KGQLDHINPQLASLMYQGALREVLYTKVILKSERYKPFSMADLITFITRQFLKSIGYRAI
ncbi:MAG: hypothetical protein OEY00_11305, partial [Gammaproteobacteria bacterium]|nr:hypothetical protein [Gammaproteobacteria bacterium]